MVNYKVTLKETMPVVGAFQAAVTYENQTAKLSLIV